MLDPDALTGVHQPDIHPDRSGRWWFGSGAVGIFCGGCPCICMVMSLFNWPLTPHDIVWLGPMHPRSQCVGGMLLPQWCYINMP